MNVLLQCQCEAPPTDTGLPSFPFLPSTGMGGAIDAVVNAGAWIVLLVLFVAIAASIALYGINKIQARA